MDPLIIFVIGLALLFDFLNGMNDAANSVATIVATRVLTPRMAVAWAAFFNLVAAFFFGVHVAKTIGSGIINPAIVDVQVIIVTLFSSIVWTHTCTKIGLPISVSHALIGGLIGAALAKQGIEALVWKGIIKVVSFIVLSPLIGMILGYFVMVAVYWVCYRQVPEKISKWFRRLQLVSAALYSLGHGTNDAQKTMGIISLLLFSSGYLGNEFHVPFWVVITCHIAIALGTLSGGWKVIETIGMKMTKLKPVHGFSAETAAAGSILFSTVLGVPVSTTHTITGSIIGVGATMSLSDIRWGIAIKIVWAWVLTIPSTAVFSGLLWKLFTLIPLVPK